MEQSVTIYLTTENVLRVLQRVSSVFSRFRINLTNLEVAELASGVSDFVIVCQTSSDIMAKIEKQLNRIIEVIDLRIEIAEVSMTEPLQQSVA